MHLNKLKQLTMNICSDYLNVSHIQRLYVHKSSQCLLYLYLAFKSLSKNLNNSNPIEHHSPARPTVSCPLSSIQAGYKYTYHYWTLLPHARFYTHMNQNLMEIDTLVSPVYIAVYIAHKSSWKTKWFIYGGWWAWYPNFLISWSVCSIRKPDKSVVKLVNSRRTSNPEQGYLCVGK